VTTDDLNVGTYVVHNVRWKPPSLDGPFRAATLAFDPWRVVRPGRQLCRPMLEGRRTRRCTALSIRFGGGNKQRKCHVHPTGGKHSRMCLFGYIVMSPVAPLRTNGITVGDDSLSDGGATLGTRRTFSLA
jgi:hypothetical protein